MTFAKLNQPDPSVPRARHEIVAPHALFLFSLLIVKY